MARAPKRQAAPGDMVRTLAVIVIPLLIITAFFTRSPRDAPVTVVDYPPILAKARQESPYPVLAPVKLPDTWRATSAIWVKTGQPFLNGEASPRNRWQLGLLNPDNFYIGLNQGDLQATQFVDEVSRDGLPDGTSTVTTRDGQMRFERRVSPDERTRSLVAAQAKVTTVIVGDVPYEALEAFASTLSSS